MVESIQFLKQTNLDLSAKSCGKFRLSDCLEDSILNSRGRLADGCVKKKNPVNSQFQRRTAPGLAGM